MRDLLTLYQLGYSLMCLVFLFILLEGVRLGCMILLPLRLFGIFTAYSISILDAAAAPASNAITDFFINYLLIETLLWCTRPEPKPDLCCRLVII